MHRALVVALGAVSLFAAPAGAQSLADRIGRAPGDALVSFSFEARDGVCGGPHFIRYGTSIHVSRGSYISTGTSESHPCEPGPVRVTLVRAGREVVGLEVGIGADDSGRETTDLGQVPGSAAADYLLDLAGTVEGRPGQAAILPAMLAAGADPTDRLLALLRNRDLARQTRQSAATWLGRELDTAPGTRAGTITSALVGVARDESDAPALRQHAMNVLARGPQGPGVGALVALAESGDPWLARTATSALAGSGDPRARQHLRAAARATGQPEGVRAAALRGLGRTYATAADLALLRELYPTLGNDREREAVVAAIGEAGGATNVQWLLGIARSAEPGATGSTNSASRAIRAASQAGATTADLVGLYDALTDRAPRSTIIGLLAERGDRAAVDKLLAIARGDTDASLRRTAIQRLGNSSDPRVRAALGEIAGR